MTIGLGGAAGVTLVCDLERRRIVDILPDCELATVEAWLDRHPGIEVVARDRDAGYGRAVSRALPNALQVADRWHLLDNAGKAFLAAVRRSMPDIRTAIGSGTVDPGVLTKVEQLQYEGFLRRNQGHLENKANHMKADAVSLLAIFEKKMRLEVPLFQRQYVWTKEQQWEPLWGRY